MGHIVVVAYRPKPGQEAALRALVDRHWRVLDERGLVSARAPVVMGAADGTVVEVFEWASGKSIEQAHADPAVAALWDEFAAACDYVPLATLSESTRLFAEFQPLDR